MSIQHLVSIDREAKLSMDTGRVKIVFSQTEETHFIAACDIAVLILAHPCIRLSLPVQQELAKNGAVIVTAGEKYIPCALTLPIGINADGARRPHYQAKYIATETAGSWWAQLIKAKILGQALVAANFDETLTDKLELVSKYVETGDKGLHEAHAAQVYWPEYFKSLHSEVEFREKQGAADPINITLNYGYAVLRAIIARALVGAGLCLNFGVGHCRKDNPFNLADDFIEPFRFLVDAIVWNLFNRDSFKSFDKDLKKQLLSSLLASTVKISGKEYRLFHGVDFAVNSFCLSLEDPRRRLLLPNQPSRAGKQPGASLWTAVQFQNETQ